MPGGAELDDVEEGRALFRPPRVYFDTANLACIADEGTGGPLWPKVHDLITTGAIVPVFSYVQVTERVPVSDETLDRMDERITPLIRAARGIWVRDFHTLQRIEIENELARQGFGSPSLLSPTVGS